MFDTVASQVSALSFVDIFNFCVFLTFTLCYTYQLYYVLVVLTRRAPKRTAARNHRYAVMVAARNEEAVIADLIHSIKVQNYPAELIDVFVIADNCTDRTAEVAREAGAIVFPRHNDKQVGKGYALDWGLKAIWEQYADKDYEAYFGAPRPPPPIATPRTSAATGSRPATACGSCARPSSSTRRA